MDEEGDRDEEIAASQDAGFVLLREAPRVRRAQAACRAPKIAVPTRT
jgi:hypothetical protein